MRILFVFALCLTSLSVTAAELPENYKKSLEAAYATKDNFVIEATISAMGKTNAQFSEQAHTYLASLEDAPKVAALQEKNRLAKLPWYHPDLWSGELSAGIDLQKGNTDRQKINSAIKVVRKTDLWETTINLSQKSTHENNEKTEDEFKASGEGRYKLDDRRFLFGDAEYVKDPLSGYTYRMSETVGVGYTTELSEKAKIDTKISLGLRHSESEDTGAVEHEAIIKPALAYNRKLRDNVEFEQLLSTNIGQEFILSESTTSLKTKLFDNLYFKVVFDIDHTNEVPEGKKNMDTQTLMQIVYGF